MKAVILSAKKSEDFYPFGETRTRSMSFCCGETLIKRTVLQLRELGIQDIAMVLKHQKKKIQDYLGYGQDMGVNLTYIDQKDVGIGAALLQAEDFLKDQESFMLVYGDILTTSSHFSQFSQYIKQPSNNSFASLVHPIIKGRYGNAYIKNDLQIEKIVEKSSYQKEESNYVLSGIFLLKKDVFSILKQNPTMNFLYKILIQKEQFYAILSEEDWMDLSYPWSINSVVRMVMKTWRDSIIPISSKIRKNVNIRGIVRMGENCEIASGTTIQGPCYIGDNVFIGNNCLIRDCCSIENHASIGFGSEVKSSIFFPYSSLGRLSFIGDSVIGENVKIENFCTTINYDFERTIIVNDVDTEEKKIGVFIGDNVVIGNNHTLEAGLIIETGKKIKDNASLRKKFRF